MNRGSFCAENFTQDVFLSAEYTTGANSLKPGLIIDTFVKRAVKKIWGIRFTASCFSESCQSLTTPKSQEAVTF